MSKDYRKHGVINKEKYRKRASKRKWTDREYHVQDNSDVVHRYVKTYCDTNQLPVLPFYGPHPKPHGARVLRKHYHLRFDTKLGHGICAIDVYHVPVFHVHQCLNNLGFLVYQKNKDATNLSQIVLTGQLWAYITIVISLT